MTQINVMMPVHMKNAFSCCFSFSSALRFLFDLAIVNILMID